MAYSLVKDDPGLCAVGRAVAGAARAGWHDASPGRGAAPGERHGGAPRDIGVRGGFDARLLPRDPPGAQRVVQQRRRRHAAVAARPPRAASSTPTVPTGRAARRPWACSCGCGSEHRAAAGGDRLRHRAVVRPRLLPAGHRRPDAGAARSGVRVPAHLGFGPVGLLRRRDRHALRRRPARSRGQRVLPRLQPLRLPHPDAVGRRPAQRRLLRRAARPALPPAGPDADPSHGRRAARRPRLPAEPASAGSSGCAARPRPCAPAPRPRSSPADTRSATSGAARTSWSSTPAAAASPPGRRRCTGARSPRWRSAGPGGSP